jgi:hypothetical protein
MRQKLNPGMKRMYIPGYRKAVADSATVGQVVQAMFKALSDSGYNSDLPPKIRTIIEKAMLCSEPIE